MPYTINRYNGQVVATVADGTIDSTTDLKLIGKNYAGYGEVQNENFLFLLENFANTTQPPKPLGGQLWFDSGNSKLKFYDGGKFRTTGGAEVGSSAPTGLTIGDFWWDSTNKQLFTWDGSTYVLVGPQGAGSKTTQMRSRSVRDMQGNDHPIIEAISNGDTIFIISAESQFDLDPNTSTINGFGTIRKGVTLAYTTTGGASLGQTTGDHRFWGTATNSERLGGYVASDYVRSGNALFNTLVQFGDSGYTVGSTPRLSVYIDTAGLSSFPVFENTLSDTIKFKTRSGSATKTPLTLVGPDILPGSDNQTDIGNGALRFKTINAVTFAGTATQANALYLAQDDYRTASSAASNGTVAVRTNSTEVINGATISAGALKATYFVGTATAANYADLAEKYLADQEYEVGTVVMIGGEKEVTACTVGFRAIGAVSEKPAYLMNFELEGGTAIALKGRVPVKVTGTVKKGQRMVAGLNGTAQIATGNTSDVFAIALESSDEVGIKLVECLIL